jgi:hypothetical protein
MVRTIAAFGALIYCTAAFAAPGSLSKVNTDKGEVLLELQSNGSVLAKIIAISTMCELSVSGEDKDKAQSELKKSQDTLREIFARNGLSSAKLDFSMPPVPNEISYATAATTVEEATDAAVVGAAAAAAGVATASTGRAGSAATETYPSISLKQNVLVTVGSATEMQVARSLFFEAGCDEDYSSSRRPEVTLDDQPGAKARATAQAVQSARVQAENYAAALNLRVVRMLRISEVGVIREFLGAESDAFMQEIRFGRNRGALYANEMPVAVSVTVDFVLGPK